MDCVWETNFLYISNIVCLGDTIMHTKNHKDNGTIYKITNIITGKIYVGKTIRGLSERFDEHVKSRRSLLGCSLISKSLREYGTINHKIEVLEENVSVDIILKREQYWIDKLDTLHIGYNVKKEYIERESKRYWENIEIAKNNIALGETWNKGISPPENVRESISKTKKRKYELGLYVGVYGHKHSEETKKNLSIIARNRPKASSETKQKISNSSSDRIWCYSLFEKKRIFIKANEKIPDGYIKGKGCCWVTKNNENLNIDIWDKEKYLKMNYDEGRKCGKKL